MERNWLNRTRHFAVRVNESAFERLQAIADAEQKPLGEWCRDTLIAVASRRQPSPVEFGLLAEMTATQAIVTHLLCTAGRDGKVSTQKAQEIVDAAHALGRFDGERCGAPFAHSRPTHPRKKESAASSHNPKAIFRPYGITGW